MWVTAFCLTLDNLTSLQPPPDGANRSAPSIVPLLPLLLALLLPPLILPPIFLLLLRRTVRPVLLATAATIPFSLFLCGWWAIGASFETSGLDKVEQNERWWGTTGLRLCAVVLWSLAAWFGRLVWTRRKRLDRTAAVVEVSPCVPYTVRALKPFSALNKSPPHQSSSSLAHTPPSRRLRDYLDPLPHPPHSSRHHWLLAASSREHLGFSHPPLCRLAYLPCLPRMGLDLGRDTGNRASSGRRCRRGVVLPPVSSSPWRKYPLIPLSGTSPLTRLHSRLPLPPSIARLERLLVAYVSVLGLLLQFALSVAPLPKPNVSYRPAQISFRRHSRS